MNPNPTSRYFYTLLYEIPVAYATIYGSKKYPNLHGIVSFYPVADGILVNAEIYHLPVSPTICNNHIFGIHIHEGNSCTGNETDPFADSGMHFNPGGCEHPAHSGDLPPLFANNQGYAWNVFLSNRFKWGDIIGRTIIIHAQADDFRTQPSGDSGDKIGCGIIVSSKE